MNPHGRHRPDEVSIAVVRRQFNSFILVDEACRSSVLPGVRCLPCHLSKQERLVALQRGFSSGSGTADTREGALPHGDRWQLRSARHVSQWMAQQRCTDVGNLAFYHSSILSTSSQFYFSAVDEPVKSYNMCIFSRVLMSKSGPGIRKCRIWVQYSSFVKFPYRNAAGFNYFISQYNTDIHMSIKVVFFLLGSVISD